MEWRKEKKSALNEQEGHKGTAENFKKISRHNVSFNTILFFLLKKSCFKLFLRSTVLQWRRVPQYGTQCDVRTGNGGQGVTPWQY